MKVCNYMFLKVHGITRWTPNFLIKLEDFGLVAAVFPSGSQEALLSPVRSMKPPGMPSQPLSPWRMNRPELLVALDAPQIPVHPRWTVPELRQTLIEQTRMEVDVTPSALKGLSKMNLADLKTRCDEEGVSLPEKPTRGLMIKLLTEKVQPAGEQVVTFGKYKSWMYKEIPEIYLRWSIKETNANANSSPAGLGEAGKLGQGELGGTSNPGQSGRASAGFRGPGSGGEVSTAANEPVGEFGIMVRGERELYQPEGKGDTCPEERRGHHGRGLHCRDGHGAAGGSSGGDASLGNRADLDPAEVQPEQESGQRINDNKVSENLEVLGLGKHGQKDTVGLGKSADVNAFEYEDTVGLGKAKYDIAPDEHAGGAGMKWWSSSGFWSSDSEESEDLRSPRQKAKAGMQRRKMNSSTKWKLQHMGGQLCQVLLVCAATLGHFADEVFVEPAQDLWTCFTSSSLHRGHGGEARCLEIFAGEAAISKAFAGRKHGILRPRDLRYGDDLHDPAVRQEVYRKIREEKTRSGVDWDAMH